MIGFLHTHRAHVATFEALVAERDADRSSTCVVDEGLLTRARTHGLDDAALAQAIRATLEELERGGATVVVCTCSTIGGLAERVGADRPVEVLRVDRPMAERAVASGPRIGVLAAVESTLEPTENLLRTVASALAVEVTTTARLVSGAWDCWEGGDRARYFELIAEGCEDLIAPCDVVVLAQASMAGAVALLAADFPIPVLSSPALAVDAVLVR